MILTPKDEIYDRISKLQESLRTDQIDGALIYQNVDLFYYTGTCQNGALFVPRSGEPFFMVIKNIERAKIESPLERIEPLRNPVAIGDVMKEHKVKIPKRTGLEMDVIPAKLFEKLRKDILIEYADISMMIRLQRAVKSKFELGMMKKAAAILKIVFIEIPNLLEEGITETELSAHIEYLLRSNGHQGAVRMRAFNMELYAAAIAFGQSSATPVHFDGPVGVKGIYPAAPQIGGDKKLRPGIPIMADIVAGYGGYNVDCTRTFALKELDDKWLNIHCDTLKINDEIVKRIKPGTIPSEVYSDIIRIASDMGYADSFMSSGGNQVKFVAHGIGLEVDEVPVIAKPFKLPFQAGNTIAVEPKIIKKGKGGVGIENTYHITEKGAKNLNNFEMDIIIAG